jgi:hypothetical protein
MLGAVGDERDILTRDANPLSAALFVIDDDLEGATSTLAAHRLRGLRHRVAASLEGSHELRQVRKVLAPPQGA